MHSSYADGGEQRYVDCAGKEYRRDEPWHSIEKRLADSDVAVQWPKDYDRRIKNPLDFYLVSLMPNIVIACAPPTSAKTYPSIDSKVFTRGLVISTELNCSSPELWTTVPEVQLQQLAKTSDLERQLVVGTVEIKLVRVGEKWLAIRKDL